MNLNLYLMRHGHRADDPLDNPDGVRVPKGRELDPDISSVGERQATQIGVMLKDHASVKYIYSSPFLRAVHTAHCVAAVLSLRVRLEWGLSEFLGPAYFQDWPGMIAFEKLVKMFPTIEAWTGTGVLPECPEYDMWGAHNRYMQTAEFLIAKHKPFGEDFLLVTHGAGVCSIAPGLAGWNGYQPRPFLAAITALHFDSTRWYLEQNGDTSHLDYVRI